MPRLTLLGSVLCVAIAGVCGSCTNYDKQWDSTPALATANPAALMVGKWEGTWQSDSTDYFGELKGMVTAAGVTVDDRKTVQQYKVNFQKRFFQVPFEEFTVTLNAVKGDDKKLRFTGKKDLGALKGGVLKFEGYVDAENDVFYLDYSNDKDTGTYKMHRLVLENL